MNLLKWLRSLLRCEYRCDSPHARTVAVHEHFHQEFEEKERRAQEEAIDEEIGSAIDVEGSPAMFRVMEYRRTSPSGPSTAAPCSGSISGLCSK